MTDIFLARLKIIIGFYQVSTSTFDSFSYISWPGPIVTMMKYAKMVQLNLLQIMPLNCVNDTIKTDAYTKFLFSIIASGAVFITGIVFYCIIKIHMEKKSCMNSDEQKARIHQYKRNLYRCLVLILFITFPQTCTHILQMLPAACHRICSHDQHNCESYLKADYSIQCNTSKHEAFGAISEAALIYYIGFPLALFLILKYARDNENHGRLQQQDNLILEGMRFLYENYSPGCWFWEIVELVRKVLFSTILILMNAESRTSLGLTAIISGLYSILFALYKPIEDTFEHWLQMASLLASSVNFTIGMLMKIPTEDISSGVMYEADALIVTILLVVANVAVIAIIAGMLTTVKNIYWVTFMLYHVIGNISLDLLMSRDV
jgi:hypothetical protein